MFACQVTTGHEWFLFFDEASAHVSRSQNYSLFGYLPFVFVSSHLLFSATGRTKLTYPHVHQEQKQRKARTDNLLVAMLAEMTPSARAATSVTSLVRLGKRKRTKCCYFPECQFSSLIASVLIEFFRCSTSCRN